MPKLPSELQPFESTSDNPFDAVKAAHLLNRAGFGGTLDEIARMVELGVEKSVDQLLDFPDAGVEEISPADGPNLAAIDNNPRNFEERRRMLEGLTPAERMELNQKFMQANREAMFTTIEWWLKRMARASFGNANTPSPLQEKLTLLWHGHFTTSARDERSAWLMWQQNETLRRNAAGNFGTFVKAIARDPAMIDYLNNQQNRKDAPNENFARELMELFTLGIGNYTEKDIKEAARAFTGWHHDGDSYFYRARLHDEEIKTFFGKTGNLNGDDVIDLILAQRACAEHIVRRIWSFFASDQLEEKFFAAFAALLREKKYALRPLLRAMFVSKRFYQSDIIGTQIKSPVQLLTSGTRQLDVDHPRRQQISNALEAMGQTPFMPPNVKGWPGGRSWINTSTLFVRVNLAIQLVGAMNRDQLLPKELENSSEKAVDYWIDRLIQRGVDLEKKSTLVRAAGQSPSRESMRKVIELIVSMPEYQLC